MTGVDYSSLQVNSQLKSVDLIMRVGSHLSLFYNNYRNNFVTMTEP